MFLFFVVTISWAKLKLVCPTIQIYKTRCVVFSLLCYNISFTQHSNQDLFSFCQNVSTATYSRQNEVTSLSLPSPFPQKQHASLTSVEAGSPKKGNTVSCRVFQITKWWWELEILLGGGFFLSGEENLRRRFELFQS